MAYKPTTTGSLIERFVGCMALTTLSACYYYSALWLPVALWWYFWVSKVVGVFLLVPYFLSVALPPVRCPGLLSTWFYKCALKFHDFEEVRETSDEEVAAIEKEKKIIFAITPHGVMSISGICAAINMAPRPTPPTCAAGIIQRVPILKHVFGTFGIIGASSRTITKTLLTSSVILYVGGIAELFMSSPVEERLFVGKRKGFIKLAMITGSDVIPCYYFGNTVALEIIRNSFLKSISRKLGVSITLLWGRWGLPVPMPCKVLCVMGKPIGIPRKEFPSEDDINKYHSLYLKEVKRLFDTYKTRLPDYKDKELIIET